MSGGRDQKTTLKKEEGRSKRTILTEKKLKEQGSLRLRDLRMLNRTTTENRSPDNSHQRKQRNCDKKTNNVRRKSAKEHESMVTERSKRKKVTNLGRSGCLHWYFQA